MEEATRFDATFASCLAAAELLTPYAVMFRYPREALEPTREEFDEALRAATSVYARVYEALPGSVRP